MRQDLAQEILRLTDGGLKVFEFYMGRAITPRKLFRNPEYDDHNPGCNVFYSRESGRYLYKDFGDGAYKGDCFDYVGKKFGLDAKSQFRQILEKIVKDMSLAISLEVPSMQTASQKPIIKGKPVIKQEEQEEPVSKFSIKEREYTKDELKFWGRYGISVQTLRLYGVVALENFEIVRDAKNSLFLSSPLSPIFCYKGDGFVKIYRPKEKFRFMYGGKMPSPYCFGFEQLPARDDMVFVTGGEKDVLSLASHGFNAICFNSETATIPEGIIEMLHLRFKHIFVMYDTDETGRRAMENAVVALEKYEVKPLLLPLAGTKTEKDISDFFAAGHTGRELRDLVLGFLEQEYSQPLLMLKSCEMDFAHPPEPSEVVVSSGGVPIGTYDNLLCITGGEGTGKSHFISAIISGALITEILHPDIDTLGLKMSENIASRAVLHYDTEQSAQQLFKNIQIAIRRAQLNESPAFYHSYSLLSYSRKERLRAVQVSMDYFHHLHGGVHLVVIDGVADLVRSTNDEAECTALVEELYRLAGIYHTCIVLVLHFVPNGLKLRGHLGSELQRKAASIIAVDKDNDPALSVIKALKARDGNALDMPMTLMGWDKAKAMFVTKGQKSGEDVRKRKHERLAAAIVKVFKGKEQLKYSDLTDGIVKELDCSPRTAKDHVGYMIAMDMIVKNPDSTYCIADEEE